MQHSHWVKFYARAQRIWQSPFVIINPQKENGAGVWIGLIYLLNSIPISNGWKSDLTVKMKQGFFQAAVVSILLYGCTTWMLTKRMEKKLDGNCTRMLQAILNKSWRQHPMATNLPSQKLSKLDEPDMLDTAREAGTSS